MQTVLRKVGGSVMLVVPPVVLNELDMHVGTHVDVGARNGKLVAEHVKPKYTLAELLAQCDEAVEASADDKAWASGQAVGSELI